MCVSPRSLPSCTTFQFGFGSNNNKTGEQGEGRKYLFGILGTEESSDIFADDHPPDANGQIRGDLVLVIVLILVDIVLRHLGLGRQALPGVSLGLDVLLVGLPLVVAGRGAGRRRVDGIGRVMGVGDACTALGAHGEVLCPIWDRDGGGGRLALGALALLPLFLARGALRDRDEDAVASEGGAVLAWVRLGASRLAGAALDTRVDGAWISAADHSRLQDLTVFWHVSRSSCLRHGVRGDGLRGEGGVRVRVAEAAVVVVVEKEQQQQQAVAVGSRPAATPAPLTLRGQAARVQPCRRVTLLGLSWLPRRCSRLFAAAAAHAGTGPSSDCLHPALMRRLHTHTHTHARLPSCPWLHVPQHRHRPMHMSALPARHARQRQTPSALAM